MSPKPATLCTCGLFKMATQVTDEQDWCLWVIRAIQHKSFCKLSNSHWLLVYFHSLRGQKGNLRDQLSVWLCVPVHLADLHKTASLVATPTPFMCTAVLARLITTWRTRYLVREEDSEYTNSSYCTHSFIHFVVLVTERFIYPISRVLHRLRSSASSLNFYYPVVSLSLIG